MISSHCQFHIHICYFYETGSNFTDWAVNTWVNIKNIFKIQLNSDLNNQKKAIFKSNIGFRISSSKISSNRVIQITTDCSSD